jgi:hypothetical protein
MEAEAIFSFNIGYYGKKFGIFLLHLFGIKNWNFTAIRESAAAG